MKTNKISHLLVLASTVALFGACTNPSETNPEVNPSENTSLSQPAPSDTTAPQAVDGTASGTSSTGTAVGSDVGAQQAPTAPTDANGVKKQ